MSEGALQLLEMDSCHPSVYTGKIIKVTIPISVSDSFLRVEHPFLKSAQLQLLKLDCIVCSGISRIDKSLAAVRRAS